MSTPCGHHLRGLRRECGRLRGLLRECGRRYGLIVRLHGHRLGGHASVVSPCRCVGAEGRQRCSSAVLMVRRFEVPARVCYVRVGVGSAVSSRLLLSGREQVRDNELSWVSASDRGHFISSMKASNSGQRPILNY